MQHEAVYHPLFIIYNHISCHPAIVKQLFRNSYMAILTSVVLSIDRATDNDLLDAVPVRPSDFVRR